MEAQPLFSDDHLFSLWQADFVRHCDSGADDELLERLTHWHNRAKDRTETQLQSQFIDVFFKGTWDYWGTGQSTSSEGYCLDAQYAVPGAGERGGTGAADLALGWWGRDDVAAIAQALCEFKDIRADLDAPQKRKGNNRSPVKQCFDYLKHEFDRTGSRVTPKPTWGIVTDMNEFRLYARTKGDSTYQCFCIKSNDGSTSLIDTSPAAARQRFLFAQLFSRRFLLAESGLSDLAQILNEQWIVERELERGFYREYQQFRDTVFRALVDANPSFSGTRGQLVRLAQRFLDRAIFILFCEDMGQRLDFPSDLLRNVLAEHSKNAYFDSDGDEIWSQVKRLFRAMRDGGPFPPNHTITRFNGGLFEELPELENLSIPNRVFCAGGQGRDAQSLAAATNTLLYLSAHYNFGTTGAQGQHSITLYALGRIFEQSITDLEYMEAEADDRESVAQLTKRKRDGVYYTPEWATDYIVRETIGSRLADIRGELAFEYGQELSQSAIVAYQTWLSSSRRQKSTPPDNAATRHLRRLDAYEAALERLRIVDPACGSGAFLIQALQYLLTERRAIARERERVTGSATLFDNDANAREILAKNLYGVDINPESVEITQLALWLNTASPGKPLSNLDVHIRCGNSLVGPDFRDFWAQQHPERLFDDLSDEAREHVRVFDWQREFSDVLGPDVPATERGFDCVIGNPPYVKLQHFKRLQPDQAAYFVEQRTNGEPLYESAQTGNFDLYLLFIEKGLSLLSPHGSMGYIAPSLWLKSESGLGLRRKVLRQRSLDRWIDFKSHQVFSEATTYTALQFFTGRSSPKLRFALAPDGDISAVDWSAGVESLAWDALSETQAWNLSSADDAALMARLAGTCLPLSDEAITTHIFQGLITSADVIYQLERIGPSRYRQLGGKADGLVHEIEDEIMHPLVSGPDAKRYQRPAPTVYILFPYQGGPPARLMTRDEMRSQYPRTWEYLQKYEDRLREREHGAFDDDAWYRFGRNQNLDKQELPKLVVAQTVPGMRVCADPDAQFYLDNVRVNGILPSAPDDFWYLLGVLNSAVVDYVFRRTAKPKSGGWFEANRQYIAPLPIPQATASRRSELGDLAKRLQELHTSRRDLICDLARRLKSAQCADDTRRPEWLWADVGTVDDLLSDAPPDSSARERRTWAKGKHAARLSRRLQAVHAALRRGARLSASDTFGEVVFAVDGQAVATVYEPEDEAAFLGAQWRQVARATNVTEKYQAKTLLASLLNLRTTTNSALRDQVTEIDSRIIALDTEIDSAERAMNTLVYDLYGLTPEEIRLVESDSR